MSVHEYSIVQALLNQCEEIAEENSATSIIKVVCKIGAMSGVEIDLLRVAFDTFREGTICDSAEFIINRQPLRLKCRDCDDEYEIDSISYECRSCNSSNMEVVDGEDMYLMSLEME